MSHPFVTEKSIDRSSIGNPVPRIDRDFNMKAFLSAIIPALKEAGLASAKNCASDDDSMTYNNGRIDCGNGVELFIHALFGAKMGRVEISSGFTGFKPRLIKATIPAATYDASRDLAKLARLIKSKHVEPMIPLVAENDTAIQMKANRRANMEKLASEMEKAFPGLRCTMRQSQEPECDVYFNANGSYISGSLYEDGHINFQRFSVSSAETTRAILALISGKAV